MADLPPWSGSSSGAPGDGTVTDVKVAANAAIQQSKLALAIADAQVAAGAAIAKSKLAALAIVNADVDPAAAIAKSKLAALAIVNADVDPAAAIAKSKLAALAIVNADVDPAAAIAGSKLALTTGVHIADVFANRPAASAALNGARFFATDKLIEWQCVAAAWVMTCVLAPEVAALPAAPIDQQECIYVADAAAGVKWHLRYRAASANAAKWEAIGGPPMQATVVTQEVRANAAYGNLTTVGPSVVVPLAGDYEISYGARIGPGAVAGSQGWVSPALGANAAIDNDAVTVQTPAASASQASPALTITRTLAASDTVQLKYRTVDGVTNVAFAVRWLTVKPVRVG